MKSAVQFLTILEEKDLLPKDVLLNLYKKIAQSQQPVTAAEISQMLIDDGYLTPVLANRLMGWNVEQSSPTGSTGTGTGSGSRVSLSGKSESSERPSSIFSQSSAGSGKKEREVKESKEGKKEGEDDIGFAPIQEERQARPVLGKHRPYKTGDSSKTSGSSSSISQGPKPPAPPTPPKNPLLDKPVPSRWASSVYDREIDSSKGIVSPSLVKMAGTEKIPSQVLLRKRTRWLTVLVRGGIILGILVIVYLLITLIVSQFPG